MTAPPNFDQPITEEWLKASGFKWAQLDRQLHKHWILWLGDAVRENGGDNSFTSYEDIGIEITPNWWLNSAGERVNDNGRWFCWLRSDAAGLYHRFIHIRHMSLQIDVVRFVEAITGQPWTPEWHVGGSCRGPKGAEQMRKYAQRADVDLMVHGHPWHDIERDPDRAGANTATLRELVDRQTGRIK